MGFAAHKFVASALCNSHHFPLCLTHTQGCGSKGNTEAAIYNSKIGTPNVASMKQQIK
jgi:hypothetical protein